MSTAREHLESDRLRRLQFLAVMRAALECDDTATVFALARQLCGVLPAENPPSDLWLTRVFPVELTPEVRERWSAFLRPNEVPDFAEAMARLGYLNDVRDCLRIGDERTAITLLRVMWGIPVGRIDPHNGFVYIAMAEELNRYKIGFSLADPIYRLAALQTGSPVKLELVAAIPNCTYQIEAELHRRFEAARTHGEWFNGSPELLAFIEAHRI